MHACVCVYIYIYIYTHSHANLFFPQDPRKMSSIPKQIEQMTEAEYTHHIWERMRKHNEIQARRDGNEQLFEEIKKMEFSPKVPKWTKDEKKRGVADYGGLEGSEYQDPSKMLFDTYMLQRAEGWKRDEARAKDKMINDYEMEFKKIGEIDFFKKIEKMFSAETIAILL